MIQKSFGFEILKNFKLMAIFISMGVACISLLTFVISGFLFMASGVEGLRAISQVGFLTMFVGAMTFMLIAGFNDVDDILLKAGCNKFRSIRGKRK